MNRKFIKYINKDNPVYCDVLQYAIYTEKSQSLVEHNTYVFVVSEWANKELIKKALESLFDVKVKSVNLLHQSRLGKKYRNKPAKIKRFKKAHIRLQDGYSIKLSEGM